MIYLFTGEGGGKTIAALGLALRAVGQNQKVVVVQFMKGRKDIGEYRIQRKLGPKYKVYQFGRKGFVNLKKPSEIDKKLAKKGFEFIKKIITKKPDLLILDEINLAVAVKLLDVKEVVRVIKNIPKRINVVLTGRHAPSSLIKLADGFSEVKLIKHPFRKGVSAHRGIEF